MNLVNEGVLPPNEPDDRDERREEREVAQERERDRLISEPRSWEECVERTMKVKENSDVLY